MPAQRDTGADSPVSASELLDSPSHNYNAMRGDSHDIADTQAPAAREIFRAPSEAQTISDRGGYSYSIRPTETDANSPGRVTFSYSSGNNNNSSSSSGSGSDWLALPPWRWLVRQ